MSNKWNVDLSKELNLDSLPLEQQQEIISNAGEAIMTSIIAAVLPELEDAEREELDKMLDDKVSQEDLEAFLRKKIKNFDAIVLNEISQFKEDSLAFYGAL